MQQEIGENPSKITQTKQQTEQPINSGRRNTPT